MKTREDPTFYLDVDARGLFEEFMDFTNVTIFTSFPKSRDHVGGGVQTGDSFETSEASQRYRRSLGVADRLFYGRIGRQRRVNEGGR
jgi:hypothetical protein